MLSQAVFSEEWFFTDITHFVLNGPLVQLMWTKSCLHILQITLFQRSNVIILCLVGFEFYWATTAWNEFWFSMLFTFNDFLVLQILETYLTWHHCTLGQHGDILKKRWFLENRGQWLKMSVQAIRWQYQSFSLEILPQFYVKNIFLAQKLTKWQGFNKSNRKSMKINFQKCYKGHRTHLSKTIV